MLLPEARAALQAAQKDFAAARAAADAASQALTRAKEREGALLTELDRRTEGERADAQALAKAFLVNGGGGADIKLAHAKAKSDVAEQLRLVQAAIEELEKNHAESVQSADDAQESVGTTARAVVAAHIKETLSRAFGLNTELEKLLAVLNAAAELRFSVEDLRPFVERPGHEMPRRDERVQAASATLRAWAAALLTNPESELSENDGRALREREAAERASLDAKRRAEDEAFRAEMRAERQAQFAQERPESSAPAGPVRPIEYDLAPMFVANLGEI
ncbi:hypothetical protein [Methylocapsa acidiphila]|uniref:hypothetical protein n=1 Tax=Methylocapsa acidiphila TaxID=133552 RepID=UPI000406FFB4|nr:hypothetical protein [Methylocapsa acidiphila]